MANKKVKEVKEEVEQPRVIVAIPVSDSASMRAQTAHSIGAAIIGAGGTVVDILLRQSCDIVSNRTALVKEAIAKKATHIFFVDCDMFFPAFTIKQLLAHDKDIIGVRYNKRKFPLEQLAQPLEEGAESTTEPYIVKSMGMGVMLIKTSVFEKIKNPWFNFGRDSEGKLALGEDVWFLNMAADAGIPPFVDPTLKVGHLGEFIY